MTDLDQPKPSLRDAREKLRWAERHFEVVRPQIEAFEERDSHRFSVEIDADAGEYVFFVHDLEQVNSDWSLILGDCIHNARTALDFLAVNLLAIVTGEDPRAIDSILFPIFESPEQFHGRIGGHAKKHFGFSGYAARLEELQPYNWANFSIWDVTRGGMPVAFSLDTLNRLDNIDKHRGIHPTWTKVDFTGSLLNAGRWPDGFEFIGGSVAGGALENDAQVGHWKFKTPLLHDWTPSQVEMKAHLPLQVAIDEQVPTGQSVLVGVPYCLWVVGAILDLFEPVFSTGAPPMPVTAIERPIHLEMAQHIHPIGAR